MIIYKIFYNKVYKNTCNLITEERKGHYINITSAGVIIDGIGIAKREEVHSVEFYINGYKQVFEVNPNGKIQATDILYPDCIK